MKEPSVLSRVRVYGVDHSPWVQGLMLALHYHQIPTQLTSFPIRLSWFWRYGVTFPVLQLDDGSTHLDSFHCYEILESHGYSLGLDAYSQEERLKVQAELEKLFSIYVPGRCMPGKRWRFIHAWSTMREEPRTLSGPICRAFLSLYFWLLIQFAIYRVRKKNKRPYRLDLIERELKVWDQRLSQSDWLTGEQVGFLDFALWGHLQCMSSGLTDELIPMIRERADLLNWLERLSALPINDPSGYTKRIIDPQHRCEASSLRSKLVFWSTFLTLLLLFPLTIILLTRCLLRRSYNPAHSGAVSSKIFLKSKKIDR